MGRRGYLTLLSLLAVALLYVYAQQKRPVARPDVTATATSALNSLKAENKLLVFSASITAMATGKTRADALLQQKLVLVQPVLVHYGVDLASAKLRYDAAGRRLYVTLPDVAVIARDVDPATKEEISDSGVLGRATGTEAALRKAAEARISPEIERQARSDTLMTLARGSAQRQVRSVLSSALAATGTAVDVQVQIGPQRGS